MRTTLTSYEFAPGMALRVIEREGQPWFVAKDVCEALGMDTTKGAAQWLRGLGADERDTLKISHANRGPGNPNLMCVTESGLYALILLSNKHEAQVFRKWVTSVVLPAIRKDGAYVKGEEVVATGEMSEDEILAKAVIAEHEIGYERDLWRSE